MNTIVLYEKGKIIKNYKKVSEAYNKFFTPKKSSKSLNTSMKKINQSYPKQETFFFHEIRETETLEIIKSLPKNKAIVFKEIPMRIIKNADHVYPHRLIIIFNNCIRNGKFPDILKYAGIAPVLKKA